MRSVVPVFAFFFLLLFKFYCGAFSFSHLLFLSKAPPFPIIIIMCVQKRTVFLFNRCACFLIDTP